MPAAIPWQSGRRRPPLGGQGWAGRRPSSGRGPGDGSPVLRFVIVPVVLAAVGQGHPDLGEPLVDDADGVAAVEVPLPCVHVGEAGVELGDGGGQAAASGACWVMVELRSVGVGRGGGAGRPGGG